MCISSMAAQICPAVEATTVETTTAEAVETTTAEATEPDESTGDSMTFADMADAIDKAMSAHMNDPADTADDMLELCRATIEDLKANGLPLGEYTGDTAKSGLDENGEFYDETSIGTLNYTSALVCKMPASTLSVSDIEGITLERADSYRTIHNDDTNINEYSVTLRFNTGVTDTAMKKAGENIFSYFIENGYTDTGRDDLTRLEIARKYGGFGVDCLVQVKNDKFEIMIKPNTHDGFCDITFYKL